MTVGERIRTIRKNQGLTQKQLGEKSGMADSAIRKYESGSQNPKVETLQRIAAALNVSLGDLLGIAPDEMLNRIVTDFPDAPVQEKEGKISFSLVKNGIIQRGLKKAPSENNLLPDEFNEFEQFIESLGCYTRLEGNRYRLYKGEKSVVLSVDELRGLVRTSKATVTALIQDLIDNPPQ